MKAKLKPMNGPSIEAEAMGTNVFEELSLKVDVGSDYWFKAGWISCMIAHEGHSSAMITLLDGSVLSLHK